MPLHTCKTCKRHAVLASTARRGSRTICLASTASVLHGRVKDVHADCDRADKGAVVHAGVGKVSFPLEDLYTNIGSLAGALLSARPKGVKGSGANGYLLRASVSSTMGPSVPVSIPSLAQAAAIARSGKR